MPDNYAFTSLSAKNSVYLSINGVKYPLIDFTASFAVNQIPEAVCYLALGRNTGSLVAANLTMSQVASTASTNPVLAQMLKAQVFFSPDGDFDTTGTEWIQNTGGIPVLAFDGYVVGSGLQMVDGKVSYVVHLIHWLVDMTCSSALSADSHVDNPANLTFPAALKNLIPNAGAQGEAVFVSNLAGVPALAPLVAQDLWLALKTMLCGLAGQIGMTPPCGDPVAKAKLQQNNRGLLALKRIEGLSKGQCDVPLKYGVSLPLDVEIVQAMRGIATGIDYMSLSDLWNMTLWDIMIGNYCAKFGLILCPAIDRAVVVADLPCYRGQASNDDPTAKTTTIMWRTITPNEYEFVEHEMMIPRPLQGVVVSGNAHAGSGAFSSGNSDASVSCMSGVFIPTDVTDQSGTIMYTSMPDWIGTVYMSAKNAGSITQNNSGGNGTSGKTGPITTATNPNATVAVPPDMNPDQLAPVVRTLMDNYAQMVYYREQLRGRSGTISGKLRFDIAPGSHLQLQQKAEPFLGDADAQADDLFAQVNRVTISISAESRRASTSFELIAPRSAEENQSDRTSAAEHPFFGDNIVLGFPLTPDLDFGA